MWYASGGVISPPDDPKIRKMAAELAQRQDLRSTLEKHEDEMVKQARKAAEAAPWFEKMTALDREKAHMYRDKALATGHPARGPDGDLYPADDPWLKELHRTKHILPFEKHLLFWNEAAGQKEVLYPEEGFTHGESAAIGRGVDMRYFWDSSTLKLTAAVSPLSG